MKIQRVLVTFFFLATCAAGFYQQPEVVRFEESPESAVTCDGCRVQLTCAVRKQFTVAHLPTPHIHWQFNASNITQTQNTELSSNTTHIKSTLTISSASSDDEGWYRCVAVDGADQTYCAGDQSRNRCLRVEYLSSQAWIQVIANESWRETLNMSSFSVPILECGSRLIPVRDNGTEIVWTRNGVVVESGMDEFVLGIGDLVVYVDASRDTTIQYNCLVQLPDGTEIHYATYTLNYLQGSGQMESSASITISPTQYTPYSGQNVEIVCSILSAHQNSSLNVSWLRRSGAMDSSVPPGASYHLQGHVLRLERVEESDGGRYCCQVLGEEACSEVKISNHGVLSDHTPSQAFLNLEQRTTIHTVTLECPLFHSTLSTVWYQNGNQLIGSMGVNLTRFSSDLEALLGVYQCGLMAPNLSYADEGGQIATVARVLPQGLCNPPGNLLSREIPWPNNLVAVEISWSAPRYLANLTSVNYRITYNLYGQTMNVNSSTTSVVVYLPDDDEYIATVEVYDSVFDGSDPSSPRTIVVDAKCRFISLYPPVLSMMCSSGLLNVSWAYNSTANVGRDLDGDFRKAYYLSGSCVDDNNGSTLIEVDGSMYYEINDSPRTYSTVGVGARCTFKGANAQHPDRRAPNKEICFVPEDLLYSNPVGCTVTASVGFEAPTYNISESAEGIEVCIVSNGHGFTVNLTVTNTMNADLCDTGPFQLAILSSSNRRACHNISFHDDNILQDDKQILVMLYPNSLFTDTDGSSTTITIRNDDSVAVYFKSPNVTVFSSDSSVILCLVLEGQLGKNISLTVYPISKGIAAGDPPLFEPLQVSFSPGVNSTYRFPVDLRIGPPQANNRSYTLMLFSSDAAIITRNATLTVAWNDANTETEPIAAVASSLLAVLVILIIAIFSVVTILAIEIKKRRTENPFSALSEEFHPDTNDPILIDCQGRTGLSIGCEYSDTDSVLDKFVPPLTTGITDDTKISNNRHLMSPNHDSGSSLNPLIYPTNSLDSTGRISNESYFSGSETGYIPQCEGSAMLKDRESVAATSAESTDKFPTSGDIMEDSEHIMMEHTHKASPPPTEPPSTTLPGSDSTANSDSGLDISYPSLSPQDDSLVATKGSLPISKKSPHDSGFKENTLEEGSNFHNVTPNQDISTVL